MISGTDASGAIAEAEPLDESAYREMDLNRLVVYVLGWLRDRGLPSTFENVTVLAFRMFPQRFSLRGYPYPDSNRVNRALLQLKPKYRNWARGSTGTGFALTDDGEAVLTETTQRLGRQREVAVDGTEAERRQRGYTWDPQQDVVALLDSEAYRRYSKEGAGTLRVEDVWNAVGAFSHTGSDAIRRRLSELRRVAEESGDAAAQSYLDDLAAVFTRGKLKRRS